MPDDMTIQALREQIDELNQANQRLDQENATLELERDELKRKLNGEEFQSLRNDLDITRNLHYEAAQAWSKYQRLHECDQRTLSKIRDVAQATISMGLTHAEKGGLLKLIVEWANDRLPLRNYDDVGDIPF